MLDPERLRRADRVLRALYSCANSGFWEGEGLVRRASRIALLLCCAVGLAASGIVTAFLAVGRDPVAPSSAPQEVWERIAARIERPIRGRLSSGSRYRPCPEAGRTCGPLPSPSSPEFVEASRLLAHLAHAPAMDATSLHVQALARLTLRGADSAKVLPSLEAAAALAPDDSRIAADLLAVRLAFTDAGPQGRGGAEQDPRQAVRAASEAVRLTAAAASEPAVWFNYALTFQSVGLHATAAEGWRRFLSLEPEGEWAEEARQHLVAALTRPADAPDPPTAADALIRWAENNPLQARSYLERHLLASWAADPEGPVGQRALRLGERLAEVTARRFGDLTWADTVAALRRMSPMQRRQAAKGIVHYVAGLEAYREQRYADALDAFLAARPHLSDFQARSWGEYWIAQSLYRVDRFAEAGELLRAMPYDSARQEYLESRRLWLLALVAGRVGDLRESIELAEQALAIVERHEDLPGIASMYVNMAAPLDQLGEHDRAWAYRLATLRASARLNDYRLRHVALYDAAEQLVELGEPEAALPFLHELRANAVAWDAVHGVPLARLEAALLHAWALSAAGRYLEAAKTLEVAVEVARELRDASRVDRLSADIAVERAEVLLIAQPERALEELDRALATYQRFDYRYPLVRAQRLRGMAAERLGMLQVAEEAFRAAVAAHEDVLARIEKPDHRAGYLTHASSAYEALLRQIANSDGAVEESFDVLERSRSVWSAEGVEASDALRELQRGLPTDAALLAYRVLSDQTLVWWATTRARELVLLPVGRRAIAEQVERHEAEMAVARTLPESSSATAALYDLLLAPFESRARGIRRLTIMPDRLLRRVAFAGVIASGAGSGSALEELESLALLPAARQARWAPHGSAVGIVTVGDPAFDRNTFSLLEPLPAAAREAREVAALYPGSIALVGEEARVARIRKELRSRGTLHFAGHASFDPVHPHRSGLMLAPDRGDDGVLAIGELEELSPRGLDLVVLSACRTSAGDRAASQDWAEALLHAGVRGVVATRWEIEDASARRFVLRFHRHRAGGLSAPAALLATQRELQSEPPRVWAAYSYYGIASSE